MATPNYDDIVRNFMGGERFDRALAEQDRLGLPVGAGLRSQGGGGVVQLPGQGGAPGPYTVDPGAAMSSYLSSFTPEMMDQLFKLEQEYGTRFQDMDIAARNRNVNSFTDLIGNLTNTAGNVARDETRTQSQFEVDRFGQFGGASIAAYIGGNPYLKSAMDRSDALGGVSTNAAYDALSKQLLGGAPTPQNLTPQSIYAGQLQSGGMLTPQQVQAERVNAERIAAERVQAGQVQAGQVGQGDLGQSLYQQALNSQQQSPISQALQARGLSMATAPGQLSAEEIRAATQGSREGYASSGRLMDNASITGEALARAGAARERSMQDIAAAQQINQQLIGASQQGQALATDVLRTDIQRQQANVGNQLQAGQFNVDAMLRGDLANQQTNLQANMANQQTNLQANLANQDAFLRAGLANQQAGMEANRFNITNQQDVGRFNIGTGLQTSTYNADAANRAMESNRAFNYGANQDYLRNLGLLGNTTAATREADRAYNLNQVNTYGNVSNAGLNATGYNTPAPGVAGGMNYFTAGSNVSPSQRFDPNAGINLAATNAANLSNYGANIYGANKSLEAANKTAAATKSAGNVQAGAAIGGALIVAL